MNFLMEIIGWPLGWIMKFMYTLVNNYGVALILFTIVVRALQVPFSIKSQKTQARTSVIQPQLQELQKKYANNREKLAQEQQKLYAEYGTSPTSGCMPMLIPLVILFGIINVAYNPLTHIMRIGKDVIEAATPIAQNLLGDAFNTAAPQLSIIRAVQQDSGAFLNIPMLGQDFITSVQTVNLNFFGMDLGNVPSFAFNLLLLIPILAGVTAMLSSFISMKMSPQSSQMGSGMKITMFIMPLFSVWLTFSYPAAVGLYWIISNVLAAVQTVVLYKLYNPNEIREQVKLEMEEQRKKNRKNKKIEVEKVKVDKDGKEVVVKETVTKREAERMKIAEARKRMAEKYGETYSEDDEKD